MIDTLDSIDNIDFFVCLFVSTVRIQINILFAVSLSAKVPEKLSAFFCLCPIIIYCEKSLYYIQEPKEQEGREKRPKRAHENELTVSCLQSLHSTVNNKLYHLRFFCQENITLN